MSKENKLYSDVLSNEEIIKIGLIIKNFKTGIYDYENLVFNMKKIGINVFPVTCDLSKKKMTISTAKETKERWKNQKFIPSDINYFVISSKTYSNVVIRYDYKMIEALAYYGDLDSQKQLIGILEFQISHLVGPLNEQKRDLINSWRGQIQYLKEQISLNFGEQTVKNNFM